MRTGPERILIPLMLMGLLIATSALAAQVPTSVQNQQNGWASSGILGFITGSRFSPPLVAALICVLARALALMAATLFQSEELKQLAKSEMGQAVVTVLLLVCIVSVVTGLDVTLEYIGAQVTSPCIGVSLPPSVSSSLTMNQYAYCYVDNLYSLSKQSAKDTLKEGVDAAHSAYTSYGAMTTRWYFFYVGFTMRPDANLRLDSEIKALEFDMHQRYMISLMGQREILASIAPSLGAAALFIGVLLRALFYTRKLGGLLMAAGLALLLVWPATYLLAWVTLNVSVFGAQAVSTPADSTCPDSCRLQPPMGYNLTTNPSGGAFAAGALNLDQMNAIADGDGTSAVPQISWKDNAAMKARGAQTCFPDASTPAGTLPIDYDLSSACPAACRFYPTPADCDIAKCAELPKACKTIRAMNMSAGIDNCIAPSGGNADWGCSESTCPSYCKRILPQVEQSGASVVPTAKADECGKSDSCVKCSLYFRRYYFGDPSVQSTITMAGGNNPDCQACYALDPKCMEGIPTLLNGVCDAPEACGQPMSLSEWISKAANGNTPPDVCPTECRIDPATFADEYKDKAYRQYCETEPIKTSCNRCPAPCKVNASVLGAQSGGYRVDGGSGLSGPITCAEAPRYDASGNMLASEYDNCKRCPLSCRFLNGVDATKAPFRSLAHYTMSDCQYFKDSTPACGGNNLDVCAVKIEYANPGGAACPDGWFKDGSATIISGACPTMPALPACSPTQQIYLRADGVSDEKCPAFLANVPEFTSSLRDTSCTPPPGGVEKAGYLIASVPPNPEASAECGSLDAQKYCAPQYCPDSCKADRTTDGPFYCSVSAPGDANAVLSDNQKRCAACFSSPQCQVLLLDNTDKNVLFPRGCSESDCAIGSTSVVPGSGGAKKIDDPITGVNPTNPNNLACDGFCFPRAQIPTTCGSYTESFTIGTVGPANLPQIHRTFSDCAACPLDCRYDNKGVVRNAPSCGDNYASQPCGWCPTLVPSSTNVDGYNQAICQDASHYYGCSTVASSGHQWYRSDGSVIPYDNSCTGYPDCAAYKTAKQNARYTELNEPVMSCQILHKYDPEPIAGVRECGNINNNGGANANPFYNLCGYDNCPASTCDAKYDAKTVACQPLFDAFTADPAPNQCLHCPLFCRSMVDGSTICAKREGRSAEEWDRGGNAPVCGTGPTEICDMRTENNPADSPSFLPGFCGVDAGAFNLQPNGPCQKPSEGYGALCPARCRILMDSSDPSQIPYECTQGEVGEACARKNLPTYCQASPPSRLCQGCKDCQTDCTAKPYVRQNCQELCLASDMINGGQSAYSPQDLMTAMGGAAGNTAWRNLGNESIAVLVLPIFCIIITLSFIRSLSPVLGGDIEIPGILKLI